MIRVTTMLLGISAATAGPARADTVVIYNGSRFVTTGGQPVQAHGAGVIKVGRYFYLLGENRAGYLFRAVSMYRSTDLRTWEFRRDILTPASHPALNPANIERPKVIYNAATRRYVLWAHKENGRDYRQARVVVATSDTVDGDYRYLGEFRPLGHESRDMTLFLDDDGRGYLISAARDNYDLNIYRLTDDFTGVAALVATLKGYHREAPAVFRRGGVYFLVTSAATGWNPNRAAYQTAPAMAGPWTAPAPFGDARTYNSQSTFVLPIQGKRSTSYLYMGDQWGPAFGAQINGSGYVWAALEFPTTTSLAMTGHSQITIDADAGTITSGGLQTPTRMRDASSGLCLRVRDGAPGYGAPVVQSSCDDRPESRIELRKTRTGDRQFVFQHSGLCLAQGERDTAAVQTACGAGLRTHWTQAGGRIVNRASGLCLNVAGDARESGARVITYPCGNTRNARWAFTTR